MPYLRIYDGDTGARELEIKKPEILIGRQEGVADILIDHPEVSRRHAVIRPYGEGHMVEDAGSQLGILVNGHPMPCAQLAHGVTIQIGSCTLEYRTDDAERAAAQANDSPLGRTVRHDFAPLPSDVHLRYRTIAGKAESLFHSGDTVAFGQKGVLLATASPLPKGQCLEVEIAPRHGALRRFLGEVREVLQDRAAPEMCIKLHLVGKHRHEALTQNAGAWAQG